MASPAQYPAKPSLTDMRCRTVPDDHSVPYSPSMLLPKLGLGTRPPAVQEDTVTRNTKGLVRFMNREKNEFLVLGITGLFK